MKKDLINVNIKNMREGMPGGDPRESGGYDFSNLDKILAKMKTPEFKAQIHEAQVKLDEELVGRAIREGALTEGATVEDLSDDVRAKILWKEKGYKSPEQMLSGLALTKAEVGLYNTLAFKSGGIDQDQYERIRRMVE